MNIMSIEELKERVTDRNNKMKLIHVVWLCLKYVEKHLDEKCLVGIFWLNDKEFMLNSAIFGDFTNRKPNTMNRNFRTHGFGYRKSTSQIRSQVSEIYPNTLLPDPKNWIVRWCEKFNKETTESEVKDWKYKEIIVKDKKKKYANPSEIINDYEIINNLKVVGGCNADYVCIPSNEQNSEKTPSNSISFDIFDDLDIMKNDIKSPEFNNQLNGNDFFPNILDSVNPFETKDDVFQIFEQNFYNNMDETIFDLL